MGLTRDEHIERIERFLGQRGRPPVGSVESGAAAIADGSFHDSEFLRSAKGSTKMVSVPVPPSGYELHGSATGILEIPAVEGYETAWRANPGAQTKSWGIAFVIQPLQTGRLKADLASTEDGQVVMATSPIIGADPLGGIDINSIRISLAIAGSDYSLRLRWGTLWADHLLKDLSSLVPFDITKPFGVSVWATQGTVNSSVKVQCLQGPLLSLTTTINAPNNFLIQQFFIGGTPPARRPYFGIQNPCHCVITEVDLFANLLTTGFPTGWRAAANYLARVTTTTTTADTLLDSWRLLGTTTSPVSQGGRVARMIGNRVHRDTTGVTTAQTHSLYFDGTGALLLPDPKRLRESPKDRTQGGVEGHYLELTEYTIGFWFDLRRIPWRYPQTARACLLCWSTPQATNFGVATDPLGGSYPDGKRPSEHLRVEIERPVAGSNWYLRAYFGELEPESLKHPTGTVGGQTTTTWPPALSSSGEPPVTWNKPQDDPTVSNGAANGKAAFQVLLGNDNDATHPTQYKWLVFLQRKFVAQGSASNACSVYLRRYTTTGVLDGTFTEAWDLNGEVSTGIRRPANQSCFSAARINGFDVNFLPEQYVFSFGAGIGSRFGDEKKGYDGTTRLPGCYPADADDATLQISDEVDGFPGIFSLGSPFMVRRFLNKKDRDQIAVSGRFGPEMRTQFSEDTIFSLNFDEPGGTILREARGNDPAYATKYGVAVVLNDPSIDLPVMIGTFPRPEPVWNNEVTLYPAEYGAVNGIVQRIDSGGSEEVYAIAQAGLYAYNRTTHAFARAGTLPGQGGPAQSSVAIDNQDIIHIAGGAGRPVLITRDRMIALSGIERPSYHAPTATISAKKVLTGGITVDFQAKTDPNITKLAGYEIDDAAVVQFAIGYWSDALRTRSRPGPVVTARYANPSTTAGTTSGAGAITRYRLVVSGLPPPRGPNASLITHWEIYRSDSNGKLLLLERRIPVSNQPVSTFIGDKSTLGEEADFLRGLPPEGMRAIVTFGDRLIGVSPPEFPRSVYYTKLRDTTNWPPIYRKNLNETASPAVGAVVRRDRAFALSRDHFYQVLDGRTDADPTAGVFESVDITPLIHGCGALSQFAVVSDDDNGIYVPGSKTVYLTEGGTYRSISKVNDSSGEITANHWSWPDSWDISDPDAFVSFHDERRRIIGICGPSREDPERRDAMLIFYERAELAGDGRSVAQEPEMSRLQGVNMKCTASILDPVVGARQIWFGTPLGYICRLGDNSSVEVDYDWLPTVTPKMGIVIDTPSSTQLVLDLSITGYPATDLFRGSVLRLYRDDVLISTWLVIITLVSPSSVLVTLNGPHLGLIGDTFTIGAMPMQWISGKLDFGTMLQDKAVQSADLAMAD